MCYRGMIFAHDVAVKLAIAHARNVEGHVCVLTRFVFFDDGLYMFCVACMILAYVCSCTVCDSSPSHFYEQDNARKYKDVCVLRMFDLSNMDCICVV